MIHFDGVTARYPRAPSPAVDDVTASAPRGVMTAVAGPNGSGKSTLVRLLLRAHAPERGAIRIDDSPLVALERRDFARRVSVVPQREESAFALTVPDYVSLGRFPHEGPWRGPSLRDEAAVDRAIELTGVRELLGRATTELSGGEWQRVRIARALAQGGEALVLDEPTTFLDVAHEMDMFELFARLAREGRAVLVISHQLNLLARFADTLVLLHRGRVVASGPPGDVMRGETLERVYGWPVVVTRDPAVGAPALVPLRRETPR